MIKNIIKNIFTIIVLFSVIMTSVPTTVYGATAEPLDKDEQLRQSINDVTFLLKEIMNAKYDTVVQEVKDLITEKGYDFTLSMESFYDQPNPLKDADCIRYLAAYMSCKNYAKQKNFVISSLREIPFIKYNTQEVNSIEYIPTKVDDYVQDSKVQDEYIRYPEKKYITEKTEMPVYVQQKNGKWKKTDKTMTITPDSKKIVYINVTLSVITPDEIFDYLKIDRDLVKDDYDNRIKRINEVTSNDALTQTLAISLPTLEQLNENDIVKYSGYFQEQQGIRRAAVEAALSLAGKVPYEWGGKADGPGYDPKWWTYNPKSGLQHGLDCSGFVQWTMMTAGINKDTYSKLGSTSSILSSGLRRINKSELKPGDIGVTNKPSGQVNHTGIYLGNDLWIHCSSSKRTVVVSNLSLTVFYDPYTKGPDTYIEGMPQDIAGYEFKDSEEGESEGDSNSYSITKYIDTNNSIYYTQNCTNDDITLLAKLIYHEARGEGIDGWIGVAEVVANRLASTSFPNTVKEVIYQRGQFSGSEYIEGCKPTAEMLAVAQMVLSGNLKVLNNPQCMYFRNPKKEGIVAATPIDWGSHRWYKAINNHAFYMQ